MSGISFKDGTAWYVQFIKQTTKAGLHQVIINIDTVFVGEYVECAAWLNDNKSRVISKLSEPVHRL